MFSIAQVVRQFKQQWTTQLDDQSIEHACREAGVVWRDRVLPPVYVIKLFLLQILHGNTACHHLPHLADRKFSGEAYCKARMRLPLALLQYLLAACTQAMLQAVRDSSSLWRGQPGGQSPGCGFPVAHYYGITGNSARLSSFRTVAACVWYKWLSRRKRKPRPTWAWFTRLLERYSLPPTIPVHSVCREAKS